MTGSAPLALRMMSRMPVLDFAWSGSPPARDDFCRTVGPAVVKYVARMEFDPDTAADLVQETYARILGGLDGFRGDSAPTTWALGIATNVCREHLRRRDKATVALVTEPCAPEAHPLESLAGFDDRERLRGAIDDLPSKEREMLVLRVANGASYKDIARITGRTLADVKVTIHRARSRLATRLGIEKP